MSSIGAAKETVRGLLAPIMRYERHLSAIAMVAGFGFDNYAFGRIDRPGAHLVFGGYLSLAAITIAAAHGLQARADRIEAKRQQLLRKKVATASPAAAATLPAAGLPGGAITVAPGAEAASIAKDVHAPRWRTWLPAATQFAFGSLWSGFLVFYSRSASFAVSWLFLATLLAFLVGNEFFRKYHSRLVFSSLLLFFAIYSYAIFTLPVVIHQIDRATFLASGLIAILCFVIFLYALAALGRVRFRKARWPIFGGTIAIAVAMNVFYFTSILPPLPLALTNVGVYHAVKRTGNVFDAQAEPQSWLANYGFEPGVIHVAPKQSISLFSAVFAPVKLTTRIFHRWQWYDPRRKHWIVQSRLSFPINGGRDGGYRAYTVKTNPRPGDWRVDIETTDGRLIGRTRFTVEAVAAPFPTQARTLN